MADFCMQCSIETFGEDSHDLAGLSTLADSVRKKYAVVLCEGCGQTMVNHLGKCVSPRCRTHGVNR